MEGFFEHRDVVGPEGVTVEVNDSHSRVTVLGSGSRPGPRGAMAAQLARWGGATVIGTVRRSDDLERVSAAVAAHTVALDQPDPAGAIRAYAPNGVDRIIEVAFSENADLDATVAKNHTVIAAYGTRRDRPDFPFWPMLFDNVTLRLLGSDDFPAVAKQQAAADLTAAAGEGALSIPIGIPIPLDRTAEAHDRVDAGARQRVVVSISGDPGFAASPGLVRGASGPDYGASSGEG